MLCILAFILFLILFPVLGFFPKYRKLYARSWSCVIKKVSLKPCDMSFGEEIKTSVVKKLVFKFPLLAKFVDKTFAFWTFLLVVISLWSLVASGLAGLNLLVYDTCEPIGSGEGCSLSGEACGIPKYALSFSDAWEQKRLPEWSTQGFLQFGETVSMLPTRFKNWQAEDYLLPNNSYFQPFDAKKKTALEIIDPGCQFCRKLFFKIKESPDFQAKYNLTYFVYPIPDNKTASGYKFQASRQLASYLEALKGFELPKGAKSESVKIDTNSSSNSNANTPADWQFLSHFWTKEDSNPNPSLRYASFQEKFNNGLKPEEIEPNILLLLGEIGFDAGQIEQIKTKAGSEEVKNSLAKQKEIVEKDIKTLKIPTIIYDGRRHDRIPEKL